MNGCRSAIAFCLCLGLLASGCSRPAVGVTVARSAVPHRIISLAPSVTEVLFAMGAGQQVIACTRLCNYPPEVRRLPRIGDMHVDYEAVVGLGPDLVVAESITPGDVTRRLEALGLEVLRVDSSTLEGYMRTLVTLGEATGHRPEARQLAEGLRARLDTLRKTSARIPLRERRTVFVEIWSRPLQTAGGGTFIDQMVSLSGGINIFQDVEQYPQVNPEAVLVRDPQIVLLTTSQPEAFLAFEPFRSLAAVRDSRVYFVDPDTIVRPSPRLPQGLDTLARLLSP